MGLHARRHLLSDKHADRFCCVCSRKIGCTTCRCNDHRSPETNQLTAQDTIPLPRLYSVSCSDSDVRQPVAISVFRIDLSKQDGECVQVDADTRIKLDVATSIVLMTVSRLSVKMKC